MSIYSSKRKSRRASRSQLGHLKLSVYEDSSALIIHVYEARGLMRREGAPLDTYVKLYLLPDPHKLSKEKTKILKQKDPVFNEKFTYILSEEEDMVKKLFISAWSRHTTSRNEMIGCMTFKVSEILGPDKGLNGWYQLLDEVKGQSEYHQVPSTISRTEGAQGDPGVKRFAVTLVRSERGYGFSVDGLSPVFISKVLKGFPADKADMRVGDQIMEVEGTDVTKASAKLVVSIFQKCPQVIHLILQRSSHAHLPTQYASLSLRRSHKKSSLPTQQYQSQLSLNSRPHPQRASLQLSPHSQGLVPEYHSHTVASRRASAPHHDVSFTQPDYQPTIAEAGHMTSQVISRWPSSGLGRSREQLYASQGQLRGMDPTGLTSQPPNISMHESFGRHTLTQPYHEDPMRHTLTQLPPEAHTEHTLTQPLHKTPAIHANDLVRTVSPRSKQVGMASSNDHTSVQDSPQADAIQPVDWESQGAMAQQRQRVVQSLLLTEHGLCDMLTMGLETYVDPLRSVLPPESHQKMFLGLTKLHSVSMAILAQLKARQVPYTSDSSPVSVYIERLADIYWMHLKELMECLKVILDNSSVARQEISISTAASEQFARLIEDSVVKEKKHTIYSFVESANDYIPKITRSMFNLVCTTSLSHDDHRHLHSITEELMSVCRDKELVGRWGREQDAIRRLQLCVGFGGKVKQFRLQTPGRMLVHEGELLLVERKKKRKVWVLLLSDLLLITRRQGKVLTVLEDPLPLDQLTVQDITYTDANEIQISTINKSWKRLFRAVGEADKDVWMTKLKERASGSLGNKRKGGDKPRSGIQPHIQDALRKQSQQIQASAVAMDTPGPAVLSSISPLSNGGVASVAEGKQEGALKRGSSKRRSLFNVGRDKKEKQSSSDREAKNKRSFRGKAGTLKRLTLADVSVETLKRWKISFDTLIHSAEGLLLFEEHLKTEFSEENIQFWKACERFKTVPEKTLGEEARAIHEEFVVPRSPKQVNLDHQTVREIQGSLENPGHSLFIKAQHQIFILMQRDSFKRFTDSDPFQTALKK